MIESELSKLSLEDKGDKQAQESSKTPDRTGEFLRWVYDHPYTDMAAELELEKYQFLAPLEETGIIPKIEDPNPYDPDKHPDEYEQWWASHTEEEQTFSAAFVRREQALRDLWLGVVLFRLSGGNLFEGIELSRKLPNRLP